ncbi:MAG: homoserine O-acetyltransferase [Alphaproteobacteria bacterium]|nr:homoserine O-acetyltransferase [Alphaproteobacteria bacterium]
MFRHWFRCGALAVAALLLALPVIQEAAAQDVGIVEKKVFSMPSYTTAGGKTIRDVKVGWESYGTLNANRDNVIIVPHFFTGNSHAAGKYKAEDAAPGYWNAIIGPGKPIDTDKFYVVSVDSLVNLNTKDPNTTTTGPASINPETGKPYGMSFPIVTMRDFVNVQKALLDSLRVTKVHAAVGASMGALQSIEWANAYPDFVERLVPVIGGPEASAWVIGRTHLWADPILIDPNWNNGDYYGKAEPTAGLALALKLVTLDAQTWTWADKAFGRKWADAAKDPAAAFDNKYQVQQVLDAAGSGRARASDANSFLYLVKANQLFFAGHTASLEDGLAKIKAKTLFLPAKGDLLLVPGYAQQAAEILKKQGKSAEVVEIAGDRGHLDGLFAIGSVGEPLRRFLDN